MLNVLAPTIPLDVLAERTCRDHEPGRHLESLVQQRAQADRFAAHQRLAVGTTVFEPNDERFSAHVW